jgi:tight adherence protein B
MTVLAVLLAATSAALLFAASPAPSSRWTGRSGPPAGPGVVVGLVGLSGLVIVWFLAGTHLVLALIGLAAALGVARIIARSRSAAAAERRSDQVLALCDALAADLAAGQPPLAALDRGAVEWVEFAPVAAAGRLGADVPDALRALAKQPGAGQLVVLAAAWQVAHRSGAGLADAVGQAAAALRSDRTTTRLVSAELAAAHATARLMVVLPVGVLLLGSGLGGDPVGFLTDTPAGLGCLAAGLAFSYAGLVWLHHIADGVLAR